MVPPKIVVTLVTHRNLTAHTADSLEKLRLNNPIPWTLAICSGDALIGRGRSIACTNFLEMQIEIPYMLFIDEDIVFTPDDINRIYTRLEEGYDVVGGIYAVRGASQLSSYGWDGTIEVDGQVAEIEYLATGFMGISRKILEKMRDELELPLLNQNDWAKCHPFFEGGRCFTYKAIQEKFGKVFKHVPSDKTIHALCKQLGVYVRDRGDNIYISEDWDFCDKVRAVGGKVYVDTMVQVGHLRENVYYPKDVFEIQQKAKLEQTVYAPVNKHIDLAKTLPQDLQEFLGWSPSKIDAHLQDAQKALADKWKLHSGSTEDFYKDNEGYLFDLTLFNMQKNYYTDRLGQLMGVTNKQILDIGCGIGTNVFILSDQGNEVTGWDINQRVIDFCEFRKRKHGLKGTFSTEKPDYSKFDLITAIDVLEHIEDLKGFLADLGSNMKSHCKFYHSDYFPKDDVWLMHFEEHASHLADWLKEGGLTIWDERWAIKR